MKILLVVDLQKEFKDKDGKYESILNYVKEHSKEYDKVIATMCMNSQDSAFIKYNVWNEGLGKIENLEFRPNFTILKESYGLGDYTILSKSDDYDIIGFNTDACVLKIAFDMFDKGYNFRVLSDYCYSSLGKEFHMCGLKIMKEALGEAVI